MVQKSAKEEIDRGKRVDDEFGIQTIFNTVEIDRWIDGWID